MELSRPPPSYVSHDPSELQLPAIPTHEISPPRAHADITLPDLKTVLSQDFDHATSPPSERGAFASFESPASVHSLPPIDPGPTVYGNGMSPRASMESAMISPSEAGSTMSLDGPRSSSAVSMNDEKVRIAAEALSGLGNPSFARSPSHAPTQESRRGGGGAVAGPQDVDEPLLQLFAKAHPWVGGTINGSLSAYSTTKQSSPRFVQYGANLVERNITTPVVSTVSSVGRMTGVESGLRWYYGGGNSSRSRDLEQGMDGVAQPMSSAMDVDSERVTPSELRHDPLDSRLETLPAYRASRPPSYREELSPTTADGQLRQPAHNRSWSSHVFVMTSGLGAALSETSRRSLLYCLSILSQAAEHVQTVMDALRMVLEQYDRARSAWHQKNDSNDASAGINSALEKGEPSSRPRTPEHDDAARHLADIITKHSNDIWNTLKTVVNYISNSAGGALPENARHFVRTQLMSLPQRWRFVSESQTGDSETSRGAHRMIAFATEGLDMMSQVSLTMKLTLDSAEKWLARVGRREATGERKYEEADVQANSDGSEMVCEKA